MLTKTFFTAIAMLQEFLVRSSVVVLLFLPPFLAFFPDFVPSWLYGLLFDLSLIAVFLVMMVRPLADLFPTIAWLRPLVILRKGFGVFSASLIVAIMLSRVMQDGWIYFVDFVDPLHWRLSGGAVFAPLGDITAVILLVTSNKFSKRVLKKAWKPIQRLSYVYFFSAVLYESIALGKTLPILFGFMVLTVTLAAFIGNRIPFLQPKRP